MGNLEKFVQSSIIGGQMIINEKLAKVALVLSLIVLGRTAYPSQDFSEIDVIPLDEINSFFINRFDIQLVKDPITIQFNSKLKFDIDGQIVGKNYIALVKGLSISDLKKILVHELVHNYRYSKLEQEANWFEEGLANYSLYLFTSRFPIAYKSILDTKFQKTNHFCLYNDKQSFFNDKIAYASSFVFMNYLIHLFGGNQYYKHLMNCEKSGWDCVVEMALKTKSENLHSVSDEWISKDQLIRSFSLAWIEDLPSNEHKGLFSMQLRGERNHQRISLLNKPPTACPVGSEFSIYYANNGVDITPKKIRKSLKFNESWDVITNPLSVVQSKPGTQKGEDSTDVSYRIMIHRN